MGGSEGKYIQEAFDANWVAPLGPNVDAFEEDLRRFTGAREVVALSSGTAAIHLALVASGVGPGDEILVQSLTFCASANPVKYLGAVPVFVDSEKESWNMDPDLLEYAIEDRISKTGKTPKAIIPVALYGMPYRIDGILEIAERYGITVIEDAAEGFGSLYKGRMLGTFGDYGIYSFNGNKMITTSGGGALVCGSLEEKNRILWYASQAREAYPFYHHEAVGYNYRLSNVSAGIGRGQMLIVEEHIAHHRRLLSLYLELLSEVHGITVRVNPSEDYNSNYWLINVTVDPSLKIKGQENVFKTPLTGAGGGMSGVVHVTGKPRSGREPNDTVEALRMYLDTAGIESRPLCKPMHRQPVFKDSPAYLNGVSDHLFDVGLCLPAGPLVTEDDVRYIVDKIKESIEG